MISLMMIINYWLLFFVHLQLKWANKLGELIMTIWVVFLPRDEDETHKSWVWRYIFDFNHQHRRFFTISMKPSLGGEMIQFDKYFSDGLKPPTRYNLQPIIFAHETNAIRDIAGYPHSHQLFIQWTQELSGFTWPENALEKPSWKVCNEKPQSLQYHIPKISTSIYYIYIYNLHNKKHLQRLLFGWLRKAPKQSVSLQSANRWKPQVF